MKSAIVALCFISCAYAAVSSSADAVAETLRSTNEQSPEGGFHHAFETSNGIVSQAAGVVKQVGKETVLEITGSEQFQSPEGQVFSLTYTADENGYHPEGAHLPTPPAPERIPEYIQRSLEYNAAHPYVEKKL